MSGRRRLSEVRLQFPPPLRLPDARRRLRESLEQEGRTLVVLDDDPTGTQTVRDVEVLLAWDRQALERALAQGPACFYLSTNSRSLPPAEAAALARRLGEDLAEAERLAGRRVTTASRSDSTLRGHFPLEIDALLQGDGRPVDGVLLAPALFEAGRCTFEDTHWVAGEQGLTPAGETEFARDPHFGYRSSNLKAWVEEKTGGRVAASQVASLSLELIRRGGVAAAAASLDAAGGRYVVVNALEEADLEVVCLAVRELERQDKRFLFRCGASIVKVYAGVEDASPGAPPLAPLGGPGLVVVGSFVDKTTRQLQSLLDLPGVAHVEVPVDDLAADRPSGRIADTGRLLDQALRDGQTAVVSTSRRRKPLRGEAFLEFGARVMDGLVEIVRRLDRRPAFVIAKGGVTSLRIAKDGLDARRATVLGQIAPGVPVWRLGPGARWAGAPYVVFPGNVGGDDTLARVVQLLRGSP